MKQSDVQADTSPAIPIPTLHLFPGERAALLDLLAGLSPAEWARPTVCPGWSVQDIAAHLLADDVGRLSGGRDNHDNPDFAAELDISTLPGLITAIDRQNALWVEAMRRASPRVLIDLLRLTGEQTASYFATLDLAAIGRPVDWVGPEPALVWLDLAREYTERWVHQQQIRDATGHPGLQEPAWFAPVLAAFVLGLPRALGTAGQPGERMLLTITGEAGGQWLAQREATGWVLGPGRDDTPTAAVTLDQDSAWRLFTRGMTPEAARRVARLSGDPELTARALETVSILA
ncbi:MAG: maleylpyruvate isomerase family mycothiol-dependent enzyme [Chloroflexota bacterium]|nr:maleylpyruvate isomerase family mycothiol-dependent enzyme [Chloroflexota bacterium]